MGLEGRSLSSSASIRFGRAYPSLRDITRKAEKICPDICLWHVCSNVCSNLLPLTVQKQLPEVFCKKRCSEEFCNIHRKTPVLESCFKKITGMKACNVIKKRQQHVPVNIS